MKAKASVNSIGTTESIHQFLQTTSLDIIASIPKNCPHGGRVAIEVRNEIKSCRDFSPKSSTCRRCPLGRRLESRG